MNLTLARFAVVIVSLNAVRFAQCLLSALIFTLEIKRGGCPVPEHPRFFTYGLLFHCKRAIDKFKENASITVGTQTVDK